MSCEAHSRCFKLKKTGITFVPKKVSLEITLVVYILPRDKTINMVRYVLVLDVNGLLCLAQHVLSQHKWGLFAHPV